VQRVRLLERDARIADRRILHRPKYFTAPGAGWDPLMRFGQTTIRDKILYGSGAFLINRPYAQLCDEMRALPLQREVLEDWLWRNAAQLLQHEK
jgi:hypothetical protein